MSLQRVLLTGDTTFYLPRGTYSGARLTGDGASAGTLTVTDEAASAVIDELQVATNASAGKRPYYHGVSHTGRLQIETTNAGRAVVWYTSRGQWGEGGGLITNPSFETDTTGWAAGGTNTIERVSAASEGIPAKFGDFVLKCTFQDNINIASNALTLTDVAHDGSVWVYIPTAWDGSALSWRFVNFTSGAAGTVVAADLDIRDDWQLISESGFNPDAGDLSGIIRAQVVGPTAGAVVYIDGASVRPNG